MFGMTERGAEGSWISCGARIAPGLVTNAARSDLPSVAGCAAGRGTRIAPTVGAESRGNRQCASPIKRPVVTRLATRFGTRRAVHVLRVIELNVKGFFEAGRKWLERRLGSVDVHMA